MIEIFQWFGSLGLVEGIFLFTGICVALALVPYYRLLLKLFRFWWKKEKGEIVAFEYDVSVDHKLTDANGYSFYLLPEQQGFLLNGGKLLLTWNVRGAYRVDIDGVGKDLKGNGAWIIVDRRKTNFKLTIHTLKGKKSQMLQLPAGKIIDVKTTAYSDQSDWNYLPSFRNLQTHSFNKGVYNGFAFTGNYPNAKVPYPETKSLYPELGRIEYDSPFGGVVRNPLLLTFLDTQDIVKLYPYNRTVFEQNGTHVFFDTRKKVKEFLKAEATKL